MVLCLSVLLSRTPICKHDLKQALKMLLLFFCKSVSREFLRYLTCSQTFAPRNLENSLLTKVGKGIPPIAAIGHFTAAIPSLIARTPNCIEDDDEI